jgi:hypothetical protein
VFGVQHCWIDTGTKQAGMGPGRPGPLPVWPVNTPVSITAQSANGRSGVKRAPIYGVNRACLDATLQIGKSCGRWGINNNCNTFAGEVLQKCGTYYSIGIP